VAAWCALLRPDVFRRLVMMSAPFASAPPLPGWGGPAAPANLHAALAALPRPRKHYQAYYGTREANADMLHCAQGLHAFLRAYYHVKSADWPGNAPQPLPDWRAETLARMPTYYVMDRDQDMARTVAAHAPTAALAAACRWLPDADLAVYAAEYTRTGFQGGLQWYRCSSHPPCVAEMQLFADRRIEVPAAFIAGTADWGTYQKPGELERMQALCSRFRGLQLLPGAGHWVQQEQPQAVTQRLLAFLADTRA
jgi:pimeloyl-ACP methyl ester carboxylesterase